MSENVATITLDPEDGAIVGDAAIDLTKSLSENIQIRLSGFGYTELTETDKTIINLLIGKVSETVKNITHQKEVPSGLMYKVVDAVCAEFLETKYSMGGINVEFEAPVTSVKEGDSVVTFKASNDAQSVFLTVLGKMKLNAFELIRYRKLVW